MSNRLKFNLHLGLVEQVTRPIRAISSAIRRFAVQASHAFAAAGRRAREFGKSINGVGKEMTAKMTTVLGGISGFSLRAAGNIETMQIKFGSLLQSTEKANELVKDLVDFTANSPFQLNGVGEAATKLVTAGTLVEKLKDRLSVLGDIAALAGANMSELGTIYSRVKSQQVAYTMELEMLSDRGVPIWQALSKITGKSVRQIRKATSQGKITFELFTKALESMREEGGVAFEQMTKQSRSWFGLLSTLRDNINLALADLGNSTIVQLKLKESVADLTIWIQNLTKAFSNLPAPMQGFIIKGGLILALLGPLLMGIGQLTIGLGITMIGFSKLVIGMAAFATFMKGTLIPTIIVGTKAILAWSAAFLATPFGMITAGITAIAVAGYMVIKHWDKVKLFWSNLWDSITRRIDIAASYIMPIIEKINQGYKAITDNSFTRGIGDATRYVFGGDESARNIPTGAQIDTGGELRIVIDENRPARVQGHMNNQKTNLVMDQGLLMGGAL